MTTTNTPAALPYSVNLWGSHPDAGNDDCWVGDDFATRDEAVACYCAVLMFQDHQLVKVCRGDWEFVEIDGPDINECTANPDQPTQRRHRRDRARGGREWQREHAMQAGMAFGCDGYNDAMGY